MKRNPGLTAGELHAHMILEGRGLELQEVRRRLTDLSGKGAIAPGDSRACHVRSSTSFTWTARNWNR